MKRKLVNTLSISLILISSVSLMLYLDGIAFNTDYIIQSYGRNPLSFIWRQIVIICIYYQWAFLVISYIFYEMRLKLTDESTRLKLNFFLFSFFLLFMSVIIFILGFTNGFGIEIKIFRSLVYSISLLIIIEAAFRKLSLAN
jgi:hypothetical protein